MGVWGLAGQPAQPKNLLGCGAGGVRLGFGFVSLLLQFGGFGLGLFGFGFRGGRLFLGLVAATQSTSHGATGHGAGHCAHGDKPQQRE